MDNLIKLIPTVQHYDWGKPGPSSLVASLTANTQDKRPYAELWLGTHPKGPSIVAESGKPLTQLLEEDGLMILGEEVVNLHGLHLPFLLKVLSIKDVLSIQAHPTKEHAKRLRRDNPEHYPDENHKPEMGIAFTRSEIFYGFKNKNALLATFESYPELLEVMPPDIKKGLHEKGSHEKGEEEVIRSVYIALVEASTEKRANITKRITKRISSSSAPLDQHLLRFVEQYGVEDIGILTCLLLNYVVLEAGEALYIGPNIPHAYISGDIIECMAASDNVVRAGLTPKFKDEKTLLEMLDYGHTTVEKVVPVVEENGTIHYPTPAKEFDIRRITRESGESSYKGASKPVLLFALAGDAVVKTNRKSIMITRGEAILIPSTVGEYSLTLSEADLVMVTVPE